MHILLTRCLIEGSSSGVQCMNCPPGQNTVGNSLNRMRKTPPRSDPSLCLSSIKLPQFSFQKTLLCKSSQIARTDPNLTAVFYMHLTSTACSHTPASLNISWLCLSVHSSCSDSSSVGSQKEGGSPASGRDPRRSSGSTSYSQVR